LAPIVAAVVMIFGIPALALSTASPAAALNNNQFGWPATGHTDAGEIAWHQANENGAQAVDIQASVGTSVFAAQSGVVVTASTGCANSNSWGCGHGFGNYVVIRHDRTGVSNPLYTLYAHLNSGLSVSTGQGVSLGTKLGVIALSGSTTGGHTHFAIGTCATPWYTGSGTCTIWNGADTSSATVNQGSATPGTYGQLVGQNPDTKSDFNGDNRDDLAWGQGSSLNLLTGQANGTFTYAGGTSGMFAPTWSGAGDFRGDGQAQVASYSSGTGTITLFKWVNSSWVVSGQTTGIGSPSWVN
jgi:murein DD-endopeptidase MepM/ murein hydrolase activator NlpD